jgi:Tfp pilus assembly protein PilZ
MGVKDDLKKTIEKHLDKAVSSFFLAKCLSIVNESSDTKESLLAAADRICKRIALFIDKGLAQRVFDSLTVEIEKKPLLQGIKRRFPRVPFCKKVDVRYDGVNYELESENLSEGGMYISTQKPFPAGSEIEIILSLGVGNKIYLTGVVVYETSPLSDSLKLPPGMAIEFKEIGHKETAKLRSYIRRALD